MTLAGVMFCIFLVLKLVGIISWSWWWVTCPLWIGFAIWIAIGGVILACGGLWAVLASLFSLFSNKKGK